MIEDNDEENANNICNDLEIMDENEIDDYHAQSDQYIVMQYIHSNLLLIKGADA